MPHAADADTVVCFQDPVVFHLLPVPEPQLAVDVAGHHPSPVVGEVGRDRVARVQVALELLLPQELEPPARLVADDLVVHGLGNEVLLLRVHHDGWARVHRRLRNVLHDHGDAVLPHEYLLVVGCGDKALALLTEGDSVHGAKVLIIFLHDLCAVRIPLHRLFVRASGDNDVLLGGVRVDGNTERSFLVGERADDLASLSVPVLNVLVVRAAEELAPIVGEIHVAHRLIVAHVRAEALPLVVVIPNLNFRVHSSR
mmetsp:Transcript_110470/g.312462  ORF Transcript_110470/g.312462 Transcript_110470/m.312462 type:complete len:255 (+) Transcript_110470:182-946(+)